MKSSYPSQDYLILFCRFLYKYRTLQKVSDRDKSFEKEKPGFVAFFKQTIGSTKKKLIKKTKEDMKSMTKKSLSEEIIYYTGSVSLTLDFIRHLRNSIAHGLIESSGNYFIIYDYYDKNEKDLSAIGKIGKEKIKSILERYIKG